MFTLPTFRQKFVRRLPLCAACALLLLALACPTAFGFEDSESVPENEALATSKAETRNDSGSKAGAELKAKQNAEERATQRAVQLREEAERTRRLSLRTTNESLREQVARQRENELNTAEIEVDSLTANVLAITQPLRQSLPELENSAHTLFTMADARQNAPILLEDIDRRVALVASDLRELMSPLTTAQQRVQNLSLKVTQMRLKKHVPDEKDHSKAAALEKMERIEGKLQQMASLLEAALAPAQTLLTRLDSMDEATTGYLPSLWEHYYLAMPSRFFDPALWKDNAEDWEQMRKDLSLRYTVEVPHGKDDWKGLGLRFLNILVLTSVVAALFYKKLLTSGQPESSALNKKLMHAFLRTVLGVALVGGSIGSDGEWFRVFIVLGSLLLISGQIALAWGLRLFLIKEQKLHSPLSPLYASTLLGILIAYPDLPEGLLSLGWLLSSIFCLFLTRQPDYNAMPTLEARLYQIHRSALWLGLGTALFGWARMSILLLVVVNCLLVNTQFMWALIRLLNRLTQNSKGEPRNLLVGIFAAFAAPVALLLGPLAATILWVIALPGGASLLWYYMESGVQVGNASFNMIHILLMISGFYLTRAVISTAQTFLTNLANRSESVDKTLFPPLRTGITYGLWSLFGLVTLHIVGFGLTNLAVIAGGLSVGIGFGLQNIVSNFMSGLILIFSRTLHEGDVVDVGGITGKVRKISVRATTVETSDNAIIFVPNSEFVSNRLINWTRNGRVVRSALTVGVAYGTKPEEVERLLLDIATNMPKLCHEPPPEVLFSDFGDSSLNFTLRYWTDIDLASSIASQMRYEILYRFALHGIESPFPQLDVHLVPGSAPAPPQNNLTQPFTLKANEHPER